MDPSSPMKNIFCAIYYLAYYRNDHGNWPSSNLVSFSYPRSPIQALAFLRAVALIIVSTSLKNLSLME